MAAFTEIEIPVNKGGEPVGTANVRQYEATGDGLKQAVEDRGLEDTIQLINSQIRIVESGKVRSGQDPLKRAEDALKGLNSDQKNALLESLMQEASNPSPSEDSIE